MISRASAGSTPPDLDPITPKGEGAEPPDPSLRQADRVDIEMLAGLARHRRSMPAMWMIPPVGQLAGTSGHRCAQGRAAVAGELTEGVHPARRRMALDTPLGYRSHQGTMLRFQALTMGLDVGHLHEVAVADRNVCGHVARSALQLDPAAADRRAPRR
jgi:hypothetical protein